MKITANNPKRKSWLTVETDSDFPIQNIPFGVFLTKDDITTIGTRIGNYAIDLAALQQLGYFEGIPLTDDIFMQDSLNDFIADGRTTWRLVRNRVADIFDKENKKLQHQNEHREVVIFDIDEIEMLMPVAVGDYTDFYSSKDQCNKCGHHVQRSGECLVTELGPYSGRLSWKVFFYCGIWNKDPQASGTNNASRSFNPSIWSVKTIGF